MDEFKVGDRFYMTRSITYGSPGGVIVLSLLRDDYNRDVFQYYWDTPNRNVHHRYDGNISGESLSSGYIVGCEKEVSVFKIRDDKHLLELRLRYGHEEI